MNIEIAEHARMSESGSSLLRLIQNNTFPVLDLLVREVVQNSLDAAAPNSACVDMDFSIGSFSATALNSHFDTISSPLNKRYSNSTCKYLAIRDCNTVGLTGPLHFDDASDGEFGNLLKLVYEISMPQQNEGAGGSWGLGKTVYFRVGIGLVIYYSRIRTARGFENRMAATLVEDQTLPGAMLPAAPGTKLRRGIAWWGKSCGKNKTRPLVNDPEIQQILKIFSIPEYTGNETGTTVIIPYIDTTKLLDKPEDPSEVAWWHSDISDYFRVALQRWYAPRLMNPEYNGKWLRAKINGQGITKREFLPLFMTLQNMYNHKADDGLFYKDVRTMNVLENGSSAGFIAYAKLNRSQLQMLPPANMPSPFLQAQISDFDKEHNAPLIAFTRKPGMIVNYEVSGKWVEGIPQTTEDEFIIGLFVLNSGNRLKSNWGNIALEEYVRKSERADHTSWADWNQPGSNSPQIIARIQRGARKAITDQFMQVASDVGARKNIGLGKALAELLLPPENFGRKASMPTPPPGGGGNKGHAGDNARFTITSPLSYSSDSISMDFELYCGKKSNTAQITLKISSENGEIKANDWESKVGSAFPAQISNVTFTKYRPEKKKGGYRNLVFSLSPSKTNYEKDGMAFFLIKSKAYSAWNSIGIEVPECTGYTICGRLTIKLSDPQLQCVVTI